MLPVSISCFISNIKVFKTLFLRNQLIFLHKLRNNVLYCLIYIFLVLISGTLPNLRNIDELKLFTRIHIILTVGTKTIKGTVARDFWSGFFHQTTPPGPI